MSDSAVALAQVIANMRTNVNAIRKALRTTSYGEYIYVWPDYHLAVKFNADGCRAVAADMATIVKSSSRLVFTNGHKQQAVLTNRTLALRAALDHSLALLERFEKLAA